MNLGGELVSLLVSLAQEIGIVVGVGALTLTLIGHLLSLHAHVNETTRRYVRAAHHLRAMALVIIILSGGAAILVHLATSTLGVLLAPAFIFKWLLIVALIVLHFTEWHVSGIKQDAVEGFEGANWYALFIVHTLAPVVGWVFLLSLYAGWVVTFGVIWAVFVWIMRGQTTLKPKPVAPVAKPAAPEPKPVPPLVSKPVPPPVVQKPAPTPPPPKPAPVLPNMVQKPAVEVHPNHSMLPMIAELDLPAPSKVEMPAPKHAAPAPPAPKPAHILVPPPQAPFPPPPPPKPQQAVELVPEFPKRDVVTTNLNESGLPALHVMPKRPEDIESSKRGPVVKMDQE